MSPNEMKVLRLGWELGRLDKVTISRKMDISTEYADCLLRSLFRSGCLEAVSLGTNPTYAFTEEGRFRLLGDLMQLQAQLEKKIDWLTYQRDRVEEKIHALARSEAAPAGPAQVEAAELEAATAGRT